MIGYLLILLLQIYCRVWWWKNFENRLAFRRVTGKNKVAPFFSGHGVYIISIDSLKLFYDVEKCSLCTRRLHYTLILSMRTLSNTSAQSVKMDSSRSLWNLSLEVCVLCTISCSSIPTETPKLWLEERKLSDLFWVVLCTAVVQS